MSDRLKVELAPPAWGRTGDTCDRKDCTRPGRFRPVLEWYPAVMFYDGTAAVAELSLKVCEEHSKDTAETERLREHLIPLATATCARMGKAAPDPCRTTLRWEPLQ